MQSSAVTPDSFRDARRKLGLSQKQTAALLHVGSDRTVRRWEAGTQDIPGPAWLLMRWLAYGEKPELPR